MPLLWGFSTFFKDAQSKFEKDYYIVTPVQAISLFSFAIFSLVDLRTRLVPFIEVFFGIAALLVFPDNRLHVTIVILAVIWGTFRRIPPRFMLPFLFYPPIWPALVVGFGVRKQMIGQADLFALAIVAVVFPFAAVITSILGFELWRRWWVARGNCGFMPAIPGLFLGLSAYSILQIAISNFV
jgi:hypothetical protein